MPKPRIIGKGKKDPIRLQSPIAQQPIVKMPKEKYNSLIESMAGLPKKESLAVLRGRQTHKEGKHVTKIQEAIPLSNTARAGGNLRGPDTRFGVNPAEFNRAAEKGIIGVSHHHVNPTHISEAKNLNVVEYPNKGLIRKTVSDAAIAMERNPGMARSLPSHADALFIHGFTPKGHPVILMGHTGKSGKKYLRPYVVERKPDGTFNLHRARMVKTVPKKK